MASQSGLGRVFNTVATASAVAIPLSRAAAVSYIFAQPGTGTATLTFTQNDSTGVKSPVALNVCTDDFSTAGGPGKAGAFYVGPDTGGTWTLTAATSANVLTLGGATNDSGVFTVRGAQLSDGYDSVVATASAGSCVAVLHDLEVQRKGANLKSTLVA